MKPVLLLILATILLPACTAPITQTPPPTPQVLAVAMTPATRTWQHSVRACANQFPEVRLLIEEIPFSQVELDYQMVVRLGTPDLQTDYFAAQIGEDQIVIVVHPENPLQDLSMEDLRLLFRGQITNWDEIIQTYPIPVQTWSYPPQDELHTFFTAAIWGAYPPLLQAYLAPDPAAMIEAISDTPGAIGYLPDSWLQGENVRPVVLEAELQAALRQPLLVLSAKEPQDGARKWVSCLQNYLR